MCSMEFGSTRTTSELYAVGPSKQSAPFRLARSVELGPSQGARWKPSVSFGTSGHPTLYQNECSGLLGESTDQSIVENAGNPEIASFGSSAPCLGPLLPVQCAVAQGHLLSRLGNPGGVSFASHLPLGKWEMFRLRKTHTVLSGKQNKAFMTSAAQVYPKALAVDLMSQLLRAPAQPDPGTRVGCGNVTSCSARAVHCPSTATGGECYAGEQSALEGCWCEAQSS